MTELYFVASKDLEAAEEEIFIGEETPYDTIEDARKELKIYNDLDQKDLAIWKVTMEVVE